MTNDQLLRFTFENLAVRGELVVLGDSWQEIISHNDCPEPVEQILGQALAATALLSVTIKFEGSLILQIQGGGPLRTVVAQATNEGGLRGLARWDGEVPASSLPDMFGPGQLVITQADPRGEPHQSIVGLNNETLAELLDHYFLHSEQLPTRFWLFVSGEKVAGLMLQQLPSEKPDPESWERLTMLAATTTADEMLSLSAQEMLHRLFHEEQVRLFEPESFRFECSCSTEKIESTLFSLGKQELQGILDEKGVIEVNCEFCNTNYQWSKPDIEELFAVQDNNEVH